MLRPLIWLALLLVQLCTVSVVNTAHQRVMLSDSYLPVAMQVIAHFVDQMAYETTDQPPDTNKPSVSHPTASSTSRPTTSKTTTKKPSIYVTGQTTYPPIKPTTGGWKPGQSGGWSMEYGYSTTPSIENSTPSHKPGLFAPIAPPKPHERLNSKHQFVLLPLSNNSEEYTVLKPEDQKNNQTLLSAETEEIKPILHYKPIKYTLLPPETHIPINPHIAKDYVLPRSAEDESTLELDEDELNDNNLQYLGDDLKDMLKLAHNPNDERAFDINDDGIEKQLVGGKPGNKVPKLTQSNLRMLLLYDLLSREAKRQKLSDFGGFSESVMKALSESGRGGARSQLSFALSSMLTRKDCQHDYANNRAKEMVAELKKDESLLSMETRYLQPLIYSL